MRSGRDRPISGNVKKMVVKMSAAFYMFLNSNSRCTSNQWNQHRRHFQLLYSPMIVAQVVNLKCETQEKKTTVGVEHFLGSFSSDSLSEVRCTLTTSALCLNYHCVEKNLTWSSISGFFLAKSRAKSPPQTNNPAATLTGQFLIGNTALPLTKTGGAVPLFKILKLSEYLIILNTNK